MGVGRGSGDGAVWAAISAPLIAGREAGKVTAKAEAPGAQATKPHAVTTSLSPVDVWVLLSAGRGGGHCRDQAGSCPCFPVRTWGLSLSGAGATGSSWRSLGTLLGPLRPLGQKGEVWQLASSVG